VVASRIRGNTDLVGENEGGILCEKCDKEGYKNAILKIYESKDLQKQYKNRNISFVKNFDTKIVLKQFEDIYEECL
jgi:glycosyltransferase involved in cell wall biosynthesis